MKKRLVLIILVMVMMATFAGTAFAEPPTRLSWEVPFYEEVDCGDFDVILDSTLRISVTYFSDDNNNPTAYEYQLKYTGTISNSATGSSFADHTAYNGRRLLTGGNELHGVVYHVNVPGEGVVMLVAGRIVWDDNGDVSFAAGPGMYEMWAEPGEIALLCESMAGY